jgi:PilZ domain
LASAAVKLQDERALPRSRVLLSGTLLTADGVIRIRIKDLSAAGAQIWAECPVRAGRDVMLKRGDTFRAARIVWSDERHAGLSFYREIPLEPLLRDGAS